MYTIENICLHVCNVCMYIHVYAGKPHIFAIFFKKEESVSKQIDLASELTHNTYKVVV